MNEAGVYQFVVYIRSGCHLCDELLAILQEYLNLLESDYTLKIIDIGNHGDNGAELEALYGQKLPVLTESGDEICHYFFDVNLWQQYIGSV